jgi:predicted regulator of Ras-like GTPase activity (Roadblock/LC7/MglB family)
VSVPLTTILYSLPAEIRQAMNGLDPATRSFEIPLADFETQMRAGKLRFKWSNLQGWCRPEPFAAAAGEVDVDLPLAELVPLFMAKRKAPDARKKFEIDPGIPDVFGKANTPAPEPAPAPAPEPAAEIAPEAAPAPAAEAPPAIAPEPIPAPAPEPAAPEPEPAPAAESVPPPTAEPEPAPEPSPIAETAPIPEAPAPAAPADVPAPAAETSPEPVPFPASASPADVPTLLIPPGPAITPFPVEHAPTGPASSHHATNPSAQALQRIRALDGVSGAFLATVDGLLIAADLPGGNENILAAFAPTVFAQLAKYCDMAQLGVPVAIDLHLGLTNIHVRKADKIFLGVLSTDGRPLPLPEVNLIAATLQPHAS